MSTRSHLAAAPCSFGIADGREADGAELLRALATADVEGIDLGPPGFLGDEHTLGANLSGQGLSISGGWVELGTGHDGLGDLDAVLALFAAAVEGSAPRPRPTLGVVDDGRLPTDPDARTQAIAALVDQAASRSARAGFPATLHPHLETALVAPDETAAVLNEVEVGLCLDTAHWHLGGWDLIADTERWSDRIDHVHVKDLVTNEPREPTMARLWTDVREVGDGDLDMAGVLDACPRTDWIVIEQDRPPGASDLASIAEAQGRSAAWLREHAP